MRVGVCGGQIASEEPGLGGDCREGRPDQAIPDAMGNLEPAIAGGCRGPRGGHVPRRSSSRFGESWLKTTSRTRPPLAQPSGDRSTAFQSIQSTPGQDIPAIHVHSMRIAQPNRAPAVTGDRRGPNRNAPLERAWQRQLNAKPNAASLSPGLVASARLETRPRKYGIRSRPGNRALAQLPGSIPRGSKRDLRAR